MFGKWQPIDTAPRDGELLLLTDANWPVLYNGKNPLEQYL